MTSMLETFFMWQKLPHLDYLGCLTRFQDPHMTQTLKMGLAYHCQNNAWTHMKNVSYDHCWASCSVRSTGWLSSVAKTLTRFDHPDIISRSQVYQNKFSPLTDWVTGDIRDDSAEILFQPFLQEAIVSISGMGRDGHSLILSIQYFLWWPWHRPPFKDGFGEAVMAYDMPRTMQVSVSWRVAWRGACGLTRKLILLSTQSLVLCSK